MKSENRLTDRTTYRQKDTLTDRRTDTQIDRRVYIYIYRERGTERDRDRFEHFRFKVLNVCPRSNLIFFCKGNCHPFL